VVDYTYEPYGRTTADATNGNTQQYTGRENDNPGNAGGLYYYRARYYMPGSARFISEDPIGWASGQTNNYSYVGGNPVSYVDPLGLQAISIPAPIAAAIARPSAGTSVNPLVSPNTSPNDPNNGGESDKCRRLREKVENLRTEVFDKRIPDLAANPLGLPRRIGPGETLASTIRGHEKLLNRQWRRFNELQDKYIDECGC
jgi:RHS repeat-associated protein